MATAARTADPPLSPRLPTQPATAPTLRRQAPGSFLDRAAVSGALDRSPNPPSPTRAQVTRVQSPQKAAMPMGSFRGQAAATQEGKKDTITAQTPTGTTPGGPGSVAARTHEIAGRDSPLMEQARQAGFRHAASRGLLSSSIAGQAAQEAVIGRAEGIAAQDVAQATAARQAADQAAIARFDAQTGRAAQESQADIARQQLEMRADEFRQTHRLEQEKVRQQAAQFQQDFGLRSEVAAQSIATQKANIQYQKDQIANDIKRIETERYRAETESERLALDAQQAQAKLWSSIVDSASKTYAAKISGLMQIQDMNEADRSAAIERFKQEYFEDIEAAKMGHSKFAGTWEWTRPERPAPTGGGGGGGGGGSRPIRGPERPRRPRDDGGGEGGGGGGGGGAGYGGPGGGPSGGSPHR